MFVGEILLIFAVVLAAEILKRGTASVGSGVVRIDPHRFVAECRTRRLNQALSVLSLSTVLLMFSAVYQFFWFNILFRYLFCMFVFFPALCSIFHTHMARYRPFVLKMPLQTKPTYHFQGDPSTGRFNSW